MKLTLWSGQIQNTITRISIFALLNLVDAVLTTTMAQAGIGTESNPLLQGLNGWELIAIKILGTALVAITLARKQRVMLALNTGMGLVVCWNLYWFLMLK